MVVKGRRDVWVKLARCCTPVPGDEIVGFVTRGNGVSVHRADCANVDSLLEPSPSGMVEVEWAPTDGLGVPGRDPGRGARTAPGCCPTSPGCCPTQHVNILSAAVTTTRDRVAVSRFTFEMGDPKHLGHVLRAVRGVEGVYDVYRVTN